MGSIFGVGQSRAKAVDEGMVKTRFTDVAGVDEAKAREAMRLAMHKLPCKCKIVSKADLEGGVTDEN